MDKKMNINSGKCLNKLVLVFILSMTLGLSGCGGGGDSAPQQTPPVNDPVSPPVSSPTSQIITGGGIKGPLANAAVTVYAFDATRPGFKGDIVTTATTDASTAITGLNLPRPLTLKVNRRSEIQLFHREQSKVANCLQISTKLKRKHLIQE